jgi:hypothetical protein
MLMDPSKRSYVNNKLEDDRRKKEKYAVMEKKKRGLVDVSLRFFYPAKNPPLMRDYRLFSRGKKRQNEQKRTPRSGSRRRRKRKRSRKPDARCGKRCKRPTYHRPRHLR